MAAREDARFRREFVAESENILAQAASSLAALEAAGDDAHPETLSWIGGVMGHRVRALGPEHFGQSGSISELYGHYGMDVNAILAAGESMSGRRVRHRQSMK